MICVFPYTLSLDGEQLRQTVAQTGLPVLALLAISLAQSAVLLAVAAGLWASRRIGLGAPLIGAWLTSVSFPQGTRRALLQAGLVGLLCAAAIILLHVIVPLF